MSTPTLQTVADELLQRAKDQGFVVQQEIWEALESAGLPAECWQDVLELVHPSLEYDQGKFYVRSVPRSRLELEQDEHRRIRDTMRELLTRYRAEDECQERRGEERIAFVQPLKVQTEDDQEFNVLSQNLSLSGIRLVSNRSLLGRKLRLYCPTNDETGDHVVLVTRILWSSAIADGLYKNGGLFLELASA